MGCQTLGDLVGIIKVSLGTCSYVKKTIYLAKWYTELNDESEVRDTILHEIAHALSYERYGAKGIVMVDCGKKSV